MLKTSFLTERQLVAITRESDKVFAKKLRGIGVMHALDLARNIRIALASYARKYRTFDQVQMEIVRKAQMVERWAHDAFVQYRRPQVIRMMPELAARPQGVKEILNAEWSRLCGKYGIY